VTHGEQPGLDQTRAAGAPKALTFASGRYVARRILGEGGQKIVYLVHDEALDRECALSLIKSELVDDDDRLRLRREAQTMAHLGAQSNIVTVFDFGEEDGKPYLVCEYVPAGDLRQELRNAGGSLPPERALALAADIARGLVVAHSRGVIHRDLKPANVLLCEDGSAKLGDFGLAFSLDRSRLTMAGTVMGTAAYLSPEQALAEPVTERSDLYSLGALLYEMLCGRPPFTDENATVVISQHIHAAPAAPSRYAEIPEALDTLILRLLAKSPDERPASAVAVLEALSAMGAGGSGSTEAQAALATPAPTVRRKIARSKWRTLVAGAAFVAGAAIAAGLVFMLRDSGGGNEAAVVPGATLVAEGYVPKLEPRDCPPELTSDPAVRCQDLVVPEDRANPAGRQIRILVMVAPSKVEPAGVPTVFIGRGAGSASCWCDGGVLSQPAGLDVRDYGDVVAVGVRGWQFSQPVLTCPEVSGLWRELLALPMNGPEANKLFLDAAEQCGRRLAGEGVDLNAYGQDEIVKDVRDLAIAMGWSQINVQGSDDLSRVAVRLAAAYPGLVRSVVLPDPLPVDAASYDDRLNNFNAAWQAYSAACRADPACEKAFPNLEQALPAVYAQLQQDPPVVTVPDPAGGPDIPVLFDGGRFADINTLGLGSQDILPIIAPVVGSPVFNPQTGATYVALTAAPGPIADPWGAIFSAYCEDVDQHVVRGALVAAEQLYPLYRVFAHDPLFDLCSRWPTQAQSRAIGLLETASAVPALILTGALDPFAPPAYAQRAAKSFTHATVAVFPPLTSYVLANGPPCISALRLGFLRDPEANLDTARDSCIAKVQPIVFAGTGSAGTTPAETPTPAP
jgi:pimeloyl-ACP methyl ester carboxylesterase